MTAPTTEAHTHTQESTINPDLASRKSAETRTVHPPERQEDIDRDIQLVSDLDMLNTQYNLNHKLLGEDKANEWLAEEIPQLIPTYLSADAHPGTSSYDREFSATYAELEATARMSREAWRGPRSNEEGATADEGGLMQDYLDAIQERLTRIQNPTDGAPKPADTEVKAEAGPTSAPAPERQPVDPTQNPNRPWAESAERYGAKNADGSRVMIEYTVLGFATIKMRGEQNMPVRLKRVETLYDTDGKIVGAPIPSEYFFSGDHITNLGKDVELYKEKSKNADPNDQTIDLKDYWDNVLGERQSKIERRKRIRRRIGRAVIGVAVAGGLIAVGIESLRKGQDVSHLVDLYNNLNGGSGTELMDPSTLSHHLSPDQVHTLNTGGSYGTNGHELVQHLGVSPDNKDTADYMVKHFGGEFTADGPRDPSQPISTEAAAALAQRIGIWH
jgi:hypothetical protein